MFCTIPSRNVYCTVWIYKMNKNNQKRLCPNELFEKMSEWDFEKNARAWIYTTKAGNKTLHSVTREVVQVVIF